MTLPAENSFDRTPIPLLRGKEGKMNREIILHLVSNGPSTIYSMASDLQKNSENTIHYSTVNRRIHDLETRDYVEKYGKVETKPGFDTDEFVTTIRGDFASLALEMTPSQRRRMLANAGRRKNSPFMLIELVIENGISDMLQELLISSLALSVKNKHIDLEQPSEAVMCAGFASHIGYGIKRVLALDTGDLEKVLEAMQYLIFRSSAFLEQLDNHEEPLFPAESDLLGEAKRASQKKDFQELFGPGFERQRRTLNSQYMWIYRLYDDLYKLYKTRGL